MADSKVESVQTFGRKVRIEAESILIRSVCSLCFVFGLSLQKTATAVAFVKKGTGLIKVNGAPISLLQPEILRLKTYEPMLLLGNDKFANVSLSCCSQVHFATGIDIHRPSPPL